VGGDHVGNSKPVESPCLSDVAWAKSGVKVNEVHRIGIDDLLLRNQQSVNRLASTWPSYPLGAHSLLLEAAHDVFYGAGNPVHAVTRTADVDLSYKWW
jgi:hypothetical protein